MLMLKRLHTNKFCCIINQWNWVWAERHVLPHLNVSPRPIVQGALKQPIRAEINIIIHDPSK